jgi:uncharacterized membrane protein YoaK (UPF0700 family)
MTTDVRQATVDFARLLRSNSQSNELGKVRFRADRTAISVIGFVIGLALGAILEIHLGLWSLIYPFLLAALSIPVGESWTMRRGTVGAGTRSNEFVDPA